MKRSQAEDVVGVLGFSNEAQCGLDRLKKHSHREWKRILHWMDDSGLAFYFLQKLKDNNRTDAAPDWVISDLEQRFAANQQRVREMSQRFTLINRAFDDGRVRYAVVKGLSLVPEFCPDPFLRYQGDFDYLVDHPSLTRAQQILLEAGYVSKPSPSSQEFIFVIPGARPARSPGHYDARSPHSIELHLDIWDSDYDGIAMPEQFFSVAGSRVQAWNGVAFPALRDDDAVLLQILHACHHLFGQWIRMSCLLEIGYFLNRRAGDVSLWKRVEERVGDNSLLREFVVVVAELANRLFAAPLPPVVRAWSSGIRPAPRVWIEHYSRQWALCEFPVYRFELLPKSKFVLFLRQQYQVAAPTARGLETNQAPRSTLLARMATDLRRNPSLLLDAGWWRRQLLVRRLLFRALAGARYLCEIPRWQWLNRASIRSKSLNARSC